MRETTIENRFRYEVRKKGIAIKFTSPGNRGVPDRLVILPRGRTLYVELKAPGKKLDPLQKRWARILRSLGHSVYMIDSLEAVDRFIAEVTTPSKPSPVLSELQDIAAFTCDPHAKDALIALIKRIEAGGESHLL